MLRLAGTLKRGVKRRTKGVRSMSSSLYVVIAALGSSALTGLVAFGVEWWRSSRAGTAARAERRSRAYSLLLTRSMIVAHLATDLHTLMEVRSALLGSVATTSGPQQLIDPLVVQQERLRAEVLPLYEAWSEVWVVGSKEAIREANGLIARRATVMDAADKRTPQQVAQWQAELRGLAEARRRLGNLARKEVGAEMADLIAGNELGNPVR
jgi:hypothetical protein